MKWNLLTVGKPSLEYARVGAGEYVRRLQRQTDFTWTPVKALPETKPPGQFWLVLDERGEPLSTAALRAKVDGWERHAVKQISVLISGADGHDPATRSQADCLLALSALTLQHELALVVFLEALYRVYSIKRGEPYHR
ncbi:MAG: 23S rRNA (pseudouridine(1915)-N(3))-methyltransferase RlmH [Verrucomicrobiales bacterium]